MDHEPRNTHLGATARLAADNRVVDRDHTRAPRIRKGKTMTTLLRLREVERRTGHSESEIYKRMGRGEFPRAVPIGERTVGWVDREIEEYIVGLIADRDKTKV